MPAGRPRKFKSAEQMQEAIQAYFDECDGRMSKVLIKTRVKGGGEQVEVKEVPDPKPYNIVGLAIALGCTRQTLLNYQKEYGPEFLDTIKAAKLKVQEAAADHTMTAKNPTGGIFNLKCNYGWQDKVVVEHQGDIGIHFDKNDKDV